MIGNHFFLVSKYPSWSVIQQKRATLFTNIKEEKRNCHLNVWMVNIHPCTRQSCTESLRPAHASVGCCRGRSWCPTILSLGIFSLPLSWGHLSAAGLCWPRDEWSGYMQNFIGACLGSLEGRTISFLWKMQTILIITSLLRKLSTFTCTLRGKESQEVVQKPLAPRFRRFKVTMMPPQNDAAFLQGTLAKVRTLHFFIKLVWKQHFSVCLSV